MVAKDLRQRERRRTKGSASEKDKLKGFTPPPLERRRRCRLDHNSAMQQTGFIMYDKPILFTIFCSSIFWANNKPQMIS